MIKLSMFMRPWKINNMPYNNTPSPVHSARHLPGNKHRG